ncbi:hypothetical protein HNY73_018054 [Argiope bruennichi]|uniref:MATH domain-containing protein n=1 Tax=Argiope bruennichi TaxID=94029 RepID=A0A8T0EBP5_ARGBR|nr:hypothetical protein HNY73_018054 [Argiope bruennichi]
MAALDVEKKSFTFTWRIKNYSFCWKRIGECIVSPTFQVLREDTSSWKLKLYPIPKSNFIGCVLLRWGKNSSCYSVGYELSFLSSDHSTLNSFEVSEDAFEGCFRSAPLLVNRDAVLGKERAAFFPRDSFTIQCKIWPLGDSILDKEQCFAESEIEIQRYSSTWTIERFSNLKSGEKLSQTFNSASIKKSPFAFNLCRREVIILLEMNPVDAVPVKSCKCQVFLLDFARKRVKCGTYAFQLHSKEIEKPFVFMLNLTRRDLLENKHRYLPNDVLTLQYEIEFSTGREIVKILEPDSPSASTDMTQILEHDSPSASTDMTQILELDSPRLTA